MAEVYLVYARLEQGAEAEALELAAHMREEHAANPFLAAGIEEFFGYVAARHGRLADAERRYAEAERIRRRDVGPAQALQSALEATELELVVREDPAAAAERLQAALAAYPLESIPPADRPYPWLTWLLAESGALPRARALLSEWEASMGDVERRRNEGGLAWARGSIALVEGRHDEAIEEFRRADVGDCQVCALPALAEAYHRAERPDSALAVAERFIETPWLFRAAATDEVFRGPILERLGRLHDARGDLESAQRYYAMLVALWEDADPALQPRVEAARTRLEEIVRVRG